LTASKVNLRTKLGASSESLAAELLEARGFRILERNWRRPQGELDLVANDRGILVFVEVRSRTGDEHGHPLETIGPRKQKRVINAARLYIQENAASAEGFRFDVVGITYPADGGIPTTLYIEDAFRA
jgi:putative endonuclease